MMMFMLLLNLFKVLLSMLLVGNMFMLLKDVDVMLLRLLVEIMEVFMEDVIIMFEFGMCDMLGVGIIVLIGEELMRCGYCWLWLFMDVRRSKLDKRFFSVFKFM